MATVRIEYDENNISIKKILEVIVALGGKIDPPAKEKKKSGRDKTLQAIKEVK